MRPADCRRERQEIRRPADGAANALSGFRRDESFQRIGIGDSKRYPRISRLRITDSNLQIVSRHDGRTIIDGERPHQAAHLISTEFTRLRGSDIAQSTGTIPDHVAVDLRLE